MARTSSIENLLTKEHGNLHDVIPSLVSEQGQQKAAAKLGVGQHWISRWLSANGYEPITQWVKKERAS